MIDPTRRRTCYIRIVFFLLLSPASANAAAIDAQVINSAALQAITAQASSKTLAVPDPAIVKLQILLDRAGVSPGVIDGLNGSNLQKAIAGFEEKSGLPVDGKLDEMVVKALTDPVPVIQAYGVTAEDAQGLVATIPDDYADQARLSSLGYTSVAEKLSERFHMDIDLLQSLNPTASFRPGETVAVAIPGEPKEDAVVKIEVHRKLGQVLALSANGSILAAYPATIGSKDNPSPSGAHKVKGVARNPPYTYNPEINFQQGNNTKVLMLPPGPNGPVGTVWIDLTEPTYGIHGTPEPKAIDKTGSHGCVRLTNWDAEELAGMVKPGVNVDFVD